MSVASSRGSPCTIGPARSSDRVEELVGDRVLDEDPERPQAHLPGVVELLDGQGDREVEVGVGEHDQRRLAAQLERQRDDVRGRRRGDHAWRSARSR